MAARNHSEIRRNNIRLLLRTIIQAAPISKRELQARTSLSWGAVSTLISELMQSGYVVSGSKQTTLVGRKPFEIDINADNHYIIGVDLNLEGICGVVTDLKGDILCERLRFFPIKNYNCILSTLYDLLDGLIHTEYGGKHIIGIGMAVQGMVDVEKEISGRLPQVEDWRDVPIGAMLEERYGCKVKLLHDPDALMIAEKNFGESYMKLASNALLIRLDKSIGLSVMADKKIYRGACNRFAEFAHLPVEMEGPVCVCGNRGCLEEFSSGGGMARRLIEAVNGGRETSVRLSELSELGCKAIGIAARQGDALCRDLFRQAGKYLGFALSGVANILNPDLIVIYGTLTAYKSLFSAAMEEQLSAHLYNGTTAKIVYSKLGRNAAARGVAFSVSEDFVNTLELYK